MDKLTIDTYNLEAEQVAKLHSSLIPKRLYALVTEYFTKNSPTLDVGCGIGRDTNWLNQQGYPALGIDGSEGMLNQAQQLYPKVDFIKDTLPTLKHCKILIAEQEIEPTRQLTWHNFVINK